MILDSIEMNAILSDPVKFHALSFSNIQETIKFGRFLRSPKTGKVPSFTTTSDDFERKESKVGFTLYGITLYISSEIVSIVNFRV